MNYKQKYYKYHNLTEIDFLECKVCGKQAVNLHHIIYKSQGGTDDVMNLCPLCYDCHDGHHTKNNPSTETLKKINK